MQMFALIVIIKLYSLTGVGLVCMRARVAWREFCLLRKRGSEMSLWILVLSSLGPRKVS